MLNFCQRNNFKSTINKYVFLFRYFKVRTIRYTQSSAYSLEFEFQEADYLYAHVQSAHALIFHTGAHKDLTRYTQSIHDMVSNFALGLHFITTAFGKT